MDENTIINKSSKHLDIHYLLGKCFPVCDFEVFLPNYRNEQIREKKRESQNDLVLAHTSIVKRSTYLS